MSRSPSANLPDVDTIRARLSEAMQHLPDPVLDSYDGAREAIQPRVEAAREAVSPKLEAARDAVSPKLEAAREIVSPRPTPSHDALLLRSEGAWVGATASEVGNRGRAAVAALRGKPGERRWPVIAAALVAGMVVGAAAGLVLRRLTARDEPQPVRADEPGAAAAAAADELAPPAQEPQAGTWDGQGSPAGASDGQLTGPVAPEQAAGPLGEGQAVIDLTDEATRR